MEIIWTPRASNHLMSIATYIARDNETAARQTVDRSREAVTHLADHPQMGRVGRINGTRELVVGDTPYIVAYRVRKSSLRILAVVHGAQQWPARL